MQTITSEALLGGWSEWSDKCQNILKVRFVALSRLLANWLHRLSRSRVNGH